MNDAKWNEEEIAEYASVLIDYFEYVRENPMSDSDINEIPENFFNKKIPEIFLNIENSNKRSKTCRNFPLLQFPLSMFSSKMLFKELQQFQQYIEQQNA